MLVVYKATEEEGKQVLDMARKTTAWSKSLREHFGLQALHRRNKCWLLYVRTEDPLPAFGVARPSLIKKDERIIQVMDDDETVPQEWRDWLSREPKPRTWQRWRGVAPDCLFWWGKQDPQDFDGVGVPVSPEQALAELEAACRKHPWSRADAAYRQLTVDMVQEEERDGLRSRARKRRLVKAALDHAPEPVLDQILQLLKAGE